MLRLESIPLAVSLLAVPVAPLVLAESTIIEEIVVTAQKRAESIQDVPIALSTFDEGFFMDTGIATVSALIDYTPGLTGSTTGYSNPIWGIRGIVSNDAFAGSENSVGVFVDEAYIGRDQLSAASFFDVNRVEVAKGPQGTLFGRNAVAGAIHIITNKPESENRLHLSAGIGNEGQRKYGLIGNWAVTDTFALRAAFQGKELDGIDTNVVNGKEREVDDLVGRVTARWMASDKVEVLVAVQGSRNENNLQRYHVPDLAAAFGSAGGGERYPSKIANDGPNKEEIDSWGVDLRVNWAINKDLSFAAIADYRYFDHFYSQDIDGIAADFGPALGIGPGLGGINFQFDPRAESYSQEFRLNGSQAQFDWFVGASLFYEDITEDSQLFTDGFGVVAADETLTSGDTNAYAVYGDLAYQVTDKLTLAAGLRFTHDEKSWCTTNVANFGGFFGNTGGAKLCDDESWSDVSPRLVADYKVSEDLMVYASYTLGYKAGGFNAQADDMNNNGIAEKVRVFDPEEVTAYELGAKSTWLDGALQVNASVYLNDYTDLQVETISNAQVFVDNASDADIKGLELEVTWLPPMQGLRVNASYARIDGEYENAIIEGANVSGNRLLQAPQNSYTLSGNYDKTTDVGSVSIFLGYNWLDEQFYDTFETEITKQDSYGIWNGSVRFTPKNESWNIAIVGENLDDKEYSLLNQDPIGFGVLHFIRGYPRYLRLEGNLYF